VYCCAVSILHARAHFALDAIARLDHQGDVTAEEIERIVQRLEQLEQSQSKLQAERDQYRALYQQMLERCRKLELGLRSHTAERVPESDQLSLGVLGLMLGVGDSGDALALPELPELEQVREHSRRKPTGRGVIPEHLPRVDIEVLPDEVKREGLDAFERIGQEVTEVLERRPSSLVVARIINRPHWPNGLGTT